LTTPPCTEGVSFLVAATPLPLHVASFNALKAVVKANSRFTQNTLGQENLLQRAADHLPTPK
jgi:carbonic anhydrase